MVVFKRGGFNRWALNLLSMCVAHSMLDGYDNIREDMVAREICMEYRDLQSRRAEPTIRSVWYPLLRFHTNERPDRI